MLDVKKESEAVGVSTVARVFGVTDAAYVDMDVSCDKKNNVSRSGLRWGISQSGVTDGMSAPKIVQGLPGAYQSKLIQSVARNDVMRCGAETVAVPIDCREADTVRDGFQRIFRLRMLEKTRILL